jgi:wyosine [tRNA(Phe)-imidazoG37] synthetase (radical SAM superfamily)
MDNPKMIAFGPVPSRRLGRSLGINNIPPKICSYSCVYCQLGRTSTMQTGRKAFYEPKDILEEVEEKVEKTDERGEPIDYLTFVPDGEPTLDCNLGEEIELLKELDTKIAVISNASLISKEDVRNDLAKADWVSLKVDAATETVWRKMNRPHRSLRLDHIWQGIRAFSEIYDGELATETMLVKNINDSAEELEKISDAISEIASKSYISIPTRPPAEPWATAAVEQRIAMAYQIFCERSINVEYLIGYEGNAFAFTGNVEDDLLSITSVHPMREEGVTQFLKKAKADWKIIEKLIHEKKLVEVAYENRKFYMRKL